MKKQGWNCFDYTILYYTMLPAGWQGQTAQNVCGRGVQTVQVSKLCQKACNLPEKGSE